MRSLAHTRAHVGPLFLCFALTCRGAAIKKNTIIAAVCENMQSKSAIPAKLQFPRSLQEEQGLWRGEECP